MNPFIGAFLTIYFLFTNPPGQTETRYKMTQTVSSTPISKETTCAQSDDSSANGDERQQSIFIIRHGDRWDYQHPEWKKSAKRKGDPSLSTLGHRQAREAGQYLDKLFVKEGIQPKDVTLLSSPFLRCIQTSNELLSEFRNCQRDGDHILIKPEYSIFEFDLWDDGLHHSLPPSMEERKLYFPRLDVSHQSAYVPKVPEDVDTFLKRCEETMVQLNKIHGTKPVLILVTHAACCIGLVKAATQLTLQDVNPAAPCSIYRLTRTLQSCDIDDGVNKDNLSSPWKVDHYTKENGFNGFTGHLKEDLGHTIPWNHFERNEENRSILSAGYTGPPQKD